MKIVVLGGGVIGVSSAWYLVQSGHEVVVVDRCQEVADETSYANAGMLSFGYTSPWAAPGVPLKAIRWMMEDLSPIYVDKSALSFGTISWLMKMLGQCNEEAYQRNKSRMLRLSQYSRECFVELRKKRRLAFDERYQGTLELFRDQDKMDAIGADLQALKASGVACEVINKETCMIREPALRHVEHKFVGGLFFPGDATGDCHKFTRELARECKTLGVQFRMGTRILKLNRSGQHIESVQTDQGELTADAFVVAMGSYSPLLLKPLGIKLPVYPIKGYSMTLPLVDESRAPQSTVMDEAHKVAITRFDKRIRVGGTAEIAGFNTRLPESRRKAPAFVVENLFAGGGDLDRAEFWTGLRPMTPDSVPVIGPTSFDNLYLNTGHGTLGWTMSQGSGQLLADIMNKRDTAIDTEGLTLQRFS